MALPKELDFLKVVEKYKADGRKTVKDGEDDFVFKSLSVDENLYCLRYSWEEVVDAAEQPAVFTSVLQRNLIAYSIVAINGNECPPPMSFISDDETGEVISNFFTIMKNIIKEWDDRVFEYVSIELNSFKDEHTKNVEERFGLEFSDVDFSEKINFKEDIENLAERDKAIAESTNAPIPEAVFGDEPIPEYTDLQNQLYNEPKIQEDSHKVEIPESQGAVVSKPPRL